MENQFESFAREPSPKVEKTVHALISCLASKGLTYAEAVEALNITEEKLGEKAVIRGN